MKYLSLICIDAKIFKWKVVITRRMTNFLLRQFNSMIHKNVWSLNVNNLMTMLDFISIKSHRGNWI